MKLIQADIVGFGKYQNQTFTFSPAFNLFLGENEAGKSTLYQFILAILFGFPKKAKLQKDYTPKSGARFGGHLWVDTPKGKAKISRFKDEGKAQVVLVADGTVGQEELLKTLLGPLTRQLYENVYAFQQEQLQDWQHLSEEELQKLLLSLGLLGSPEFLKLGEVLNREEQAIYKKTGQKPLLNQKLQELKTLEEKISKKSQEEASYQTLLAQQETTEEKLAELKEQREGLKKQQTFAESQQLLAPLQQELRALSSLPALSLSPLEEEALAETYDTYQNFQSQLQALEGELKQRSGESTLETSDYYFYLENETKLAEIIQSKPHWQEKNNQFIRLATLEEVLENQLKEGEKRYGFSQEFLPKEFSNNQKDILKTSLDKYQEALKGLAVSKKTTGKKLTPYVSFMGGLLLIVVGLFLSFPTKLILIILGALCSIYGTSQFLVHEKKNLVVEDFSKTQGQKLAQWEAEFSQIQKNYRLGTYPLAEMLKEPNEVTAFLAAFSKLQENKNKQGELTQSFQDIQQNWRQTFPFLTAQSPLGMLEELENFQKKMQQIQFAKTQQGVKNLEKSLYEKKLALKDLEESQKDTLKKAGLTYLYQVPQFLKSQGELRQKLARKEVITQQIKNFLPQQGVFFPTEKTLPELKLAVSEVEKQLEANQKLWQQLKAQGEIFLKDGALPTLLQEKANLKAEIYQLAKSWSEKKVLESLLQDFAGELSQKQLPNLLTKAATYFSGLTQGRYVKILWKEERFLVQGKTGILWEVKDLSSGTKDQLFLSFRLAFLTIAGQISLAPVIIDDGWLRYDLKRKKSLLQFLEKISATQQVILLSSDEQMAELWPKDQPIVQL